MQSGFTIGFIFRDLNEFKDLYQYFLGNNENENSFFFLRNHSNYNLDSSDEENINNIENDNDKNEKYIDNDNDDF